jgi:hypothetical protein
MPLPRLSSLQATPPVGAMVQLPAMDPQDNCFRLSGSMSALTRSISGSRSARIALVAMALSLAALVQAGAQAQQPIRQQPGHPRRDRGEWQRLPLGWFGSGSYCVKSR